MRQVRGLRAALICGAVGLMGMAGTSFGQVVLNPNFESPTNSAGGTDTNCDDWVMSPAPNFNGGTLNYTNTGQRCTFATPTPDGDSWSFWEQTFVTYGSATQQITTGITPGVNYTMTDQEAFEGTGTPGSGFNAILAANQSAGTPNNGENGGDGYSYLGMTWLDKFGNPLGTTNADGTSVETIIGAGSVTTANHVYAPYSVSGTAPVGAFGVQLDLGWANGGQDNNAGGQSAFATAVTFGVPEPASVSMIALGGLAMLARRRARTA